MPPKRKRQLRRTLNVTDRDIFVLLVGWNFFNDTLLNDGKGGIDRELAAELWSDPAVKRRVQAMLQERRRQGRKRRVSWAAETFGE